MNTTRKNLYNTIHKDLGISKNLSSKIIDDFFELFVSELINKEMVKIHSFGTFKVVKKNERIGRNPKTKVEAKISARRVVKFKPSIKFKKKINANEF
tara:strand:- start:730 stop:1020 length:291 start_codon:yes stop_codon:yes gene_type:complete